MKFKVVEPPQPPPPEFELILNQDELDILTFLATRNKTIPKALSVAEWPGDAVDAEKTAAFLRTLLNSVTARGDSRRGGQLLR